MTRQCHLWWPAPSSTELSTQKPASPPHQTWAQRQWLPSLPPYPTECLTYSSTTNTCWGEGFSQSSTYPSNSPSSFHHIVSTSVKTTIIVTRLTTSLPASSPAAPNPFSMLQSELTSSVVTDQFLSFLNLRFFKIKSKFLNITHKSVALLMPHGWIKHSSPVLSKVSCTSPTVVTILCCNCLYTFRLLNYTVLFPASQCSVVPGTR